MKAFVLDRYGKGRALRSADVPNPELRDDEALVQVHAAGVNQLDCKIRDGEFKLILPYRLKSQDFEDVLRDYDVVLNSQDGKTLERSLRVLKRGGRLISISGPPDPEFGQEIGAPGFVKLVMRLLSSGIRRKAKRRGVDYSFLFMTASGSQLREITRLFDAGVIRPVLDRVFPFESTNDALTYVEAGRAKGKVVVKVR
jgi:NADPH:quinone reductase-like Zn-dependent oxidoreductase